MTLPAFDQHAEHVVRIREAALRAVDPAAAVRQHLLPRDFERAERVFVVGAGKAGAAMAQAAADLLGPRLAAGCLAVPEPPAQALAGGRLRFVRGGHPQPTQGSIDAGRAIADVLADAGPDDLVLALISGGGSALLELPKPGLSLDDLRAATAALLASGAAINEVNVLRTQLSQLKGGGLARLAAPARVLALILSDVVGNPLASIASGPTVPPADPAAGPAEARRIVARYALAGKLPPAVMRCLEDDDAGAAPPRAGRPRTAGEQPHAPADDSQRDSRPRREPTAPTDDSPPAGVPDTADIENRLIGSNRMAGEAAAEAARALGYDARWLADDWQGEARDAGRRLAELALAHARYARGARAARAVGRPPLCLVVGGETTVTLRGDGQGGRNQEAALAAALALEGQPGIALAFIATDGVDGPTDAAGALVTGDTLARARAAGLDPQTHLDDNNAYPLLRAAAALLFTGPTGTNVNDVWVGLVYR